MQKQFLGKLPARGWTNQQMILGTSDTRLMSAKSCVSCPGTGRYVLGYDGSSDGLLATMISGVGSDVASHMYRLGQSSEARCSISCYGKNFRSFRAEMDEKLGAKIDIVANSLEGLE
jgi:hypothetical protein